ncbi:hypothetical protein Nepgr_020428 [Nepenthes gracilis]|uniref:Uncharacterized protein n=1 Tax=Nepenthes gracilis TaxID=150966 RepID=A0AAD3SY28_NEPGR|nr:hypothetical protein Nepgr_020428 [Nepenthes gracilis]
MHSALFRLLSSPRLVLMKRPASDASLLDETTCLVVLLLTRLSCGCYCWYLCGVSRLANDGDPSSALRHMLMEQLDCFFYDCCDLAPGYAVRGFFGFLARESAAVVGFDILQVMDYLEILICVADGSGLYVLFGRSVFFFFAKLCYDLFVVDAGLADVASFHHPAGLGCLCGRELSRMALEVLVHRCRLAALIVVVGFLEDEPPTQF